MRIVALSIAGFVAGFIGVLSPAETRSAALAETLPAARISATLAGYGSVDLGACVQRVSFAHAANPAECDAAGLNASQPVTSVKHMHQASDGDCTIVDAYTGACADR
jgi:hypothetical protein